MNSLNYFYYLDILKCSKDTSPLYLLFQPKFHMPNGQNIPTQLIFQKGSTTELPSQKPE